jgi:hypothetical protein
MVPAALESLRANREGVDALAAHPVLDVELQSLRGEELLLRLVRNCRKKHVANQPNAHGPVAKQILASKSL